jgi:hypothetical protein
LLSRFLLVEKRREREREKKRREEREREREKDIEREREREREKLRLINYVSRTLMFNNSKSCLVKYLSLLSLP